MSAQTAIRDRLCELCGIAPDYVDIWGNRHPVSDKTKLALLAAMGMRVHTEAELQQSLSSLENSQWCRVLPPVHVMREGEQQFRITVTFPVGHEQEECNWAVIQESGQRLEGSFRPVELEVLENREIGDLQLVRYGFSLPAIPTTGYHRFELRTETALWGANRATMSLIVAPGTCFKPDALMGEGRVWGPSVQLYAVRSQHNWGVGDLGDLRALLEFCAEQGAGIVGVSPLHALFPDNPEHAAPYTPSSRLFLNILYLDIEAIPDFTACEEARALVSSPQFQAQLRALRASEMVEYGAVAAAKLEVLERLFRHFQQKHLETGSERGREFRTFQVEGGDDLRRQALFDALQTHFRSQDPEIWGWPVWPEAYRNPDALEVAAFCIAHLPEVEFHEYVLWQATQQLAAVGHHSKELGLGVGLLLDLAVGVSRGGGETWGKQGAYALDASVGAPPDDFNLHGQDWGLPPFIPHQLRELAYAPFIATLRQNMGSAGALRIDHVMGLLRLFWIPVDGTPLDGTYVYYPFADLLGILALESNRNRCLVVGEDLGTVPDEVRDALRQLGVLSYKLLYFEKDPEGAFKSPDEYPAQSVVAATTHDLATLPGFWQGTDLDLRTELGLFPSDALRESYIITRSEERARLLVALEHAGLLPAGTTTHPVSVPEMSPEYVQAVYAYLARSTSKLLLVQPEDVFGELVQVNLPGTTEQQYPNWRRKLPLELEEWRNDPRMLAVAEAIRRERGTSIRPHGLLEPAQPVCLLPRIPRATYRLQFNRDFTFLQAADLIPYLRDLGISHCYASPYLKARPGSMHGYDIIDHNTLNPEIGSPEDFAHFVKILGECGMGQILDVVPNHMGVMGSDNAWWLDVLENGQASSYAKFFDIDWFPYKEELRGKVLLPVLGDHYGAVLENGELKLEFDEVRGEFSIFYFQHRFPVDPAEYPRILGYGIERLEARVGAEHPPALEFQSLITALGHLPKRTEATPENIAERNRDKEIHKQHLAALCAGDADIARFVEDNVGAFNAGEGEGARFNLLHELLESQAYRLAYWRVASDEINYRRFFDINDLAALRMEDSDVFQATHQLVLGLLAQGKVDGLRIDHPDGLYDPMQYFQRIQDHVRALQATTIQETDSNQQPDTGKPVYLVIEKILAVHEQLAEHWPVDGTTGYSFSHLCNGLFVNPDAADKLDRAYAVFSGEKADFSELLYANKRLIMKAAMAGELNVLAQQLSRIAASDRHTRDFTLSGLRRALEDIVAYFPVYRTYVSEEQVSTSDMQYVNWAVALAKKRTKSADLGIFDFIREVLLKIKAEGKSQPYRDAMTAFAMKFQQYTSPVMAKGMEDTSFYIYNRLVSLNEVGGDPRSFGVPMATFHRVNQDRARRFPHSMLNSTTHDSKRSEDVRARINVLSEIPDEWRRAVTRWSRINRGKTKKIDGVSAPSRNDEYLLYQTLVGAWPASQLDDVSRVAFSERIERYMLKAVREAKVHSSWINPGTGYEEAVSDFVRGLLEPTRNNLFLENFVPFQRRIARLGMFNSLSQVLLKLTAPGVPDIYQGNELWDFSLVDPDSRRPVDYHQRRKMLAELHPLFGEGWPDPARVRTLFEVMEDGRIKLYLTWKILAIREQKALLFQNGEYLPLKVEGKWPRHLCAFARRYREEPLIVIAPRWFAALIDDMNDLPVGENVWKDTWIEIPFPADGFGWINVFTGEALVNRGRDGKIILEASEVLRNFPYALLIEKR